MVWTMSVTVSVAENVCLTAEINGATNRGVLSVYFLVEVFAVLEQGMVCICWAWKGLLCLD